MSLLKKYNPITPSLRETVILSLKTSNIKIPKSLTLAKKKSAGRNNHGRITTRHQGGGHKQKIRVVDFLRSKLDIEAKVISIEYDPNRTSSLALVCYKDGEKSFILAPNGLKAGDVIISSDSADIKTGNSKMLKDIPVGTLVHCIELSPGAGGQMARSAGAYAQLMAKEGETVLLRLPSGELRKVKSNCRATIGQIGNIEHELEKIGKAGKSRHMGIRPAVRGVVMNPVDHPHGGGEGRTSGGRHPVSPWGLPTRGYKTRNNKRTDKFIVKRRK